MTLRTPFMVQYMRARSSITPRCVNRGGQPRTAATQQQCNSPPGDMLVVLLLMTSSAPAATLNFHFPSFRVAGLVLAERLWSARNITQWQKAAPRLAAQMQRLKQRGIPVNVTPWVDS